MWTESLCRDSPDADGDELLVNSWACLFNAFQSIHIHIVTTLTVYRKYCLYVAIMLALRILIVINCFGYLVIGLCNRNQCIDTPYAPSLLRYIDPLCCLIRLIVLPLS